MSIGLCVSNSSTISLTELGDGTVTWDARLFDQSLAEHSGGLAVNLDPNGGLALTAYGVAAKVATYHAGIANRLQSTTDGLWVPQIARYSGRVFSPGGTTVLPGAPDNTNFYDLPQSEAVMPITNFEPVRTLHVLQVVAEAGGATIGLFPGMSVWFAQYVDEGGGYGGNNPWAADNIGNSSNREMQQGNFSVTIPGRSLAPGQSWTIRTKTMYRQLNGAGITHFTGQQARITAVGFWM